MPPIDVSPFGFTQVAYEQEDYYHSVQWLEESVRLFRRTGSQWSPENEATLQDALDHLAFSHFKVGGGTFKEMSNGVQMSNGIKLLSLSDRKHLLGSQPFSGIAISRYCLIEGNLFVCLSCILCCGYGAKNV